MQRTTSWLYPTPPVTPRKTRSRFSLLVALGLMTSAQAVVLPPNSEVTLPGTTTTARPELVGPTLAEVVTPWDDLNGDTGTLEARVVREAAGTLDFYYRLTNAPSSVLPVFSIGSGDFGAFSPDVDFLSDSPGLIGFDTASSATFPGHTSIDFFAQSHPRIAPGDVSKWMFIRTEASAFSIDTTTYATAIALVGDSFDFQFAFAPSFVPTALVTAVPLPGTLWLVGVGTLGVMVRLGARRHQR